MTLKSRIARRRENEEFEKQKNKYIVQIHFINPGIMGDTNLTDRGRHFRASCVCVGNDRVCVLCVYGFVRAGVCACVHV